METRFTSLDAIYGFTQRKTGLGSIFVITIEYVSVLDICWLRISAEQEDKKKSWTNWMK